MSYACITSVAVPRQSSHSNKSCDVSCSGGALLASISMFFMNNLHALAPQNETEPTSMQGALCEFSIPRLQHVTKLQTGVGSEPCCCAARWRFQAHECWSQQFPANVRWTSIFHGILKGAKAAQVKSASSIREVVGNLMTPENLVIVDQGIYLRRRSRNAARLSEGLRSEAERRWLQLFLSKSLPL